MKPYAQVKCKSCGWLVRAGNDLCQICVRRGKS